MRDSLEWGIPTGPLVSPTRAPLTSLHELVSPPKGRTWGPGSAGQGEEDWAVTQGDDQEREQLWEPREEAGRPPEQRTDPRFGSVEVTDNPELP